MQTEKNAVGINSANNINLFPGVIFFCLRGNWYRRVRYNCNLFDIPKLEAIRVER